MSSDDGKRQEVVVAKERQVEPSNHGLRLSDVVGRAVGSQLVLRASFLVQNMQS